jgi:hypothetical protein
MKIADLVKALSTREIVPIDAQDDVVPLVQRDLNLEIYCFPVEMDGEILRGNMSHWEWPDQNGEIHHVLDIHYDKSLSPDWARLVCVKELIHLCDPIEARVMTEAGLDRLINKIILPPAMQTLEDGDGVWNDRAGITHALAVLFPWSCRDLFMGPFKAGKITIDEIAKTVDIPVEYAAVVMDEIWEGYFHFISA